MGYLLCALDDEEMEAVKARLEADPIYQQAMDWALGDMGWLQGLRPGLAVSPPPQLAKRTCDRVFDPGRRLRAAFRPRSMTPPPATPSAGSRLNMADLGVAVAVFVIAGILVLPAINSMRFQARVSTCRDNLRQVGLALTEYSHKNNDVFPSVPTGGNLAAAGVYAPILADEGFLAEPERLASAPTPNSPSGTVFASLRSRSCVPQWGKSYPAFSIKWGAATATAWAFSITVPTDPRGT